MSERNQHHYPPVDDRAAQWGLYVTTAGRVLDPVGPGRPYGVHPDMYLFDYDPAPGGAVGARSPQASGRILPEFQVVYITDTHAVFESDETGMVEFDGPTLLFLFPGVWHRYRPVGQAKERLTARWLGFNGDVAYRLLGQGYITPETAVRPAARPRRLAAAFDSLVDRIAADPTADPVLLSMHAMDLLANCIECAREGQKEQMRQKDGDDLVARVLDLIWTGSHRGLTMEQLCEMVGAPRRTVERRFRAARGHSLLTEVNDCRCRRARHFLERTDLPIKNVCWLAGFSNTEQMRVTFLQRVGMTPGEYRRNHHEK
jgi:AraC-like DNA-binding protein